MKLELELYRDPAAGPFDLEEARRYLAEELTAQLGNAGQVTIAGKPRSLDPESVVLILQLIREVATTIKELAVAASATAAAISATVAAYEQLKQRFPGIRMKVSTDKRPTPQAIETADELETELSKLLGTE